MHRYGGSKDTGQQQSTSKKQNVDPIKNNDPDGNAGALVLERKVADTEETEIKKDELSAVKKNKGKLLMNATVETQNITFPTDFKLLNAARKKSEEFIDILYDPVLHGKIKVRTYREVARKSFLNSAKKKRKTAKEIYKVNGQAVEIFKRKLRAY